MVAILKDRGTVSAQATGAGCLGELLQTISDATASQAMAPAGDRWLIRLGGDRREQILLDADFDGDRYLLIRVPLSQSPRLLLSPREREIVQMIAQGNSNKRVAVLLNLSVWTIGTHVRRIFAKLGVNSRAAMVARLLDAGEGGDFLSNTRSTTCRDPGDSMASPAGSARPQARPEMVAARAMFPASQNRAGVHLVPTATVGGAAYRNWMDERDGPRQTGEAFSKKRARLQ
jgi:DNA-binding CsgD family transcriptional regulator